MFVSATYTSDAATAYAEYARMKLLYLQQTRIVFKTEELIELVVGAVIDQNVRQALHNANFKETSQLIAGLTQFTKPEKEKKKEEEFKEQHC